MQNTAEHICRTGDFLRENIMNLPAEFNASPAWLVARICDGQLWYYGNYRDRERAALAAQTIGNGIVLHIPQ